MLQALDYLLILLLSTAASLLLRLVIFPPVIYQMGRRLARVAPREADVVSGDDILHVPVLPRAPSALPVCEAGGSVSQRRVVPVKMFSPQEMLPPLSPTSAKIVGALNLLGP